MKTSPYWWCKIKAQGKSLRESTKHKKKGDAREYMLKRETALRHSDDPRIAFIMLQTALDARSDPKSIRQEFALALLDGVDPDPAFILRLAESASPDTQRATINALTARIHSTSPELDVAFDAYCKQPKARPTGKGTLKAYRSIWKTFKTQCDTYGVVRIAEVDESVVGKFAGHLQGRNMSAATYNHYRQLLTAVWDCCIRKHWAQVNPWSSIPRMQKDTVHKRNLTLNELRDVLKTSDGWLKGLFTTGIYTGLRLIDCVYLETSKVNVKENRIESIPVKTQFLRKEISLPIHPSLLEQLKARSKLKRKYIFPEAVKLYEAYPNAPGSALVELIQDHFEEKAKIQTSIEVPNRKRKATVVGFHSLRHSFVTLAAEAGVDEPTLMDMVGHGSPAMTRIYNHISDARKQEAVDKLPTV
jgi:integrase